MIFCGMYEITISEATIDIQNLIRGRVTPGMVVPVATHPTKSTVPTGGVTSPMQRLVIMISPK